MLNIIGERGITRFRNISSSRPTVFHAVYLGKIKELQIKFASRKESSSWMLENVQIAFIRADGVKIREIFRTVKGQNWLVSDQVYSLKSASVQPKTLYKGIIQALEPLDQILLCRPFDKFGKEKFYYFSNLLGLYSVETNNNKVKPLKALLNAMSNRSRNKKE